MNGISLHDGFINYGATFLMFMEYARNAVRMSALMGIQNIFVYTHDSIGQGEDGPTHQAIEQIANLRLSPNLHTWRPCDAAESATAWKLAIQRKTGPSALIFSRQGLPHQARDTEQVSNITKGGYILSDNTGDNEGTPDVILIATGSEVGLATDSATKLRDLGHKVRVVSMPCTNIFDAQSSEYQNSVLPSNVDSIIAIETAHVDFWHKYVGRTGKIIGMGSLGESAPGAVLLKHFGFTVDKVIDTALALFSN